MTEWIQNLGQLTTLLMQTLRCGVTSLLKNRFPFHLTIQQMAEIGFNSLPIIVASSIFAGIVMIVQVGTQFEKFGGKHLIGGAVALTLAREVAPALTAIIVAGRIGSSYAAELGTMKVTEQIDALRSLATDPVEFLILPRFMASVTMIICLTLIFNFLGLVGGLLGSYMVINITYANFIDSIIRNLSLYDVMGGLLKSSVFGALVAIVSCREGFFSEGGAMGVGKATTQAVVQSILFILFFNLLLSIALVRFQQSPVYAQFEYLF